ncbi:NlpC/P60 family protein [Leucobacter allii]|uniref:NlpC/P60 family protein n=1 Tax=Leucobacter allii TaxID=2932247 RepID=UPI001FD0A863|nr:NlpC/P60 family protein [Leucobacter allii]UOR00844.1 NlpC/P60 family protein [Leucobacter allii]
MAQNPSTDLALVGDGAKSTKAKRVAQMAGAAVLSFGLVGTFSLPAYATSPDPEGMPDGFAAAQTLETVDVDASVLPLTAPDGEVGAEILEQEAAAKAAEEAAAKAAEEQAKQAAAGASGAGAAPTSNGYSGADVPAGAGAQGIVAAAMAQLGQYQDCTALVERSLRAIGIPAGDLGTQVGEYTGLGGTLVTSGDYAPGDVLVWSGRHVAVYIGNGQAVHGGYGGNQTVIASAFLDGAPNGVVRFG